MGVFSKIKKSIYFKESGHVLHGFEKKIKHLRNKSYRFTLPFQRLKLKNEINKIFSSTEELKRRVQAVLGDFSKYDPDEKLKQQLISQANQICEHQFYILGGNKKFDKKINWHTDFKSDFTWKKGQFYQDYKEVDLSNNADVKVPRELSRAHHFLILGQTYLATKDNKYALEFKDQVIQWIDENPLLFSINWCCAMDVAIRAANWAYALNMVIDSDIIDDDFLNKISDSLYEHGWYIERNLEKAFKYNSNHYDGDIGGLLILGLIFGKSERGKQWFEFSRYSVFNEIRNQIYPSGMELEKSSYYNRLVLEIFSYSVFLLKRNGVQIPADIEHRIHEMYVFIHELAFQNKELPIFGDNDSARFLPFDKIYRNDITYLSWLGKVYYKDEIFETASSISSEVFFLLGDEEKTTYAGLNKYTNTELKRSKIFTDVGILKIDHGNIFMIINNSSPGRFIDDPFTGGSHAHADLLSFVLSLGGIQLFVDPGSFVYTSDYKARNLFRSTAMHNTITIDDRSQFIINEKELFYYGSKAEVVNILFDENDGAIHYTGKHNAYNHLEKDLEHQRDFFIDKSTSVIKIIDNISCKQQHAVKLHFHLHPQITVKQQSDELIFSHKEKSIAALSIENVKNYKIEINNSYYSHAYGHKETTTAIDVSFNTEFYKQITSTIKAL